MIEAVYNNCNPPVRIGLGARLEDWFQFDRPRRKSRYPGRQKALVGVVQLRNDAAERR